MLDISSSSFVQTNCLYLQACKAELLDRIEDGNIIIVVTRLVTYIIAVGVSIIGLLANENDLGLESQKVPPIGSS